MTFVDLATAVLNNRLSSVEARACPDQYVGKISTFSAGQEDFPVRLAAQSRPDEVACLIMIIESPHVQEFIGEPGPARGKTGEMIRKWIHNVPSFRRFTDRGLIIVNAIQYQCSLGAPTRCFRDDMFMSAWSHGGENAFIERLRATYRNGDQLANCCTKGRLEHTELRKLVQAAITKAEIQSAVHRRTHPSSWYSEKNREYEWRP